jgi:uncharacterized protein YhfF
MTPEIPERLQAFWKSFERAAGAGVTARFYEAFHFDDHEASANELAALVLAGTKRATAGLLWSLEASNRRTPAPGDLSIMTNWSGTPLCVIETRHIAIVPYEEVTAEFAATEGEGDGSLRYWREAHWAFFGRECARIGRTPDDRMPVVCEQFEVVYRR